MAKNDSYAGQLIDEIKALKEENEKKSIALKLACDLGESLMDKVNELKEQIERMKNCENCQTVRDVEGNCFYLKSGKCIKLSMWEMKE